MSAGTRPARIVEANHEHLSAVAEIDRQTLGSRHPEQIYAEEMDRELSRLDVLVQGDSDGAEVVVAFINYWVVGDEVHLLSLATDPSRQRRGHGMQLMSRLLEVARGRRCRYVTLEVRRSNRAAVLLYERLGFRLVAVRSGYYADNREDALVMLLELGAPAD